MDQEFEASTETLRQDFEKRVKRELQTRGEKIERDLQFKYDIQMMREREQMLQEKLAFVEQESSGSALAKQEDTALTKLELAETRSTIAGLETDLGNSQNEIEELRGMIETGINPFATAKFQLKLKDLQTDFSGMEEAFLEKDQQLEEANRALEELKTKQSDPLYFVKEMFR
jgi:predicted  nucleic acid-binding Zn-ribbon protein